MINRKLGSGLVIFLSLAVINSIFLAKEAQSLDQVKRDPFLPLISKSGLILIPREVDISGLYLKGIIYSQEEPVVIINDEVLKVESIIGEYTVSQIKEKEVILRRGNQIFTLRLEEE